ncbi:hypothetical protein H8E88_10265 [candidate division KSB1 bacterium]|nr:hypothetical protein [candidate division KSB1 bacterium]
MKIPKSFNIFGQKYNIKFDDHLIENDGDHGQARYRKNEIVLQKTNNIIDRPQSQTEATYLHEMIHIIFHEIGEDELRDNEKLVVLMANTLHQILETSEY